MKDEDALKLEEIYAELDKLDEKVRAEDQETPDSKFRNMDVGLVEQCRELIYVYKTGQILEDSEPFDEAYDLIKSEYKSEGEGEPTPELIEDLDAVMAEASTLFPRTG